MPLSTQSQSESDEYILVASLDNARNLSNILKAISFKDHAIFNATQNGLKVTVEDSKCLQANAFIQADIFQEFTIKQDVIGFQVNLTVLLDCLTIFGGSTVPGKYHRLSTFGNSGNAHYDYPKDSDMMELFQCTKTQTNRYKMSLLKPSTKALGLSCKVSVRTDSRGFLSLQYLVRNDDGQICFVEYYCCPDEEVDEE
ncbi:hypothetical protein P4O66_017702 [Electrophorus voltai]|uniref:RAD1 homolog (S. pombe) n=1 Tax=Electrophorus voltai TaxID=2609070 RepID=A0AAD9DKM0_9TELE|nr:hypothetical protein P4O66_017702 [Electrophorus voltai]